MTALLRNCFIFLKFCVLDNFRFIISWAKNEICSIVGKHVFWPSNICDTGHISIQSWNKMLYLYTKFWLVLTQNMFFLFCMVYLVCSLVTHIYDKGHIGFIFSRHTHFARDKFLELTFEIDIIITIRPYGKL